MKNKKVFKVIFISFSIIILFLPLVVSANDFLTKVVEKNVLYVLIQNNIVPLEAKIMGRILITFGYKFAYSISDSIILVNGINLKLTWNCLGWQSFLFLLITLFLWNCLGWQSFLFLLITLFFGLKGKYSFFSSFEAVVLGVLGTFWVNIARILFTVLLAVHALPIFRIVFHDYLAAFTTIIWLFFYWWFCYSYILVPKVIAKIEHKN